MSFSIIAAVGEKLELGNKGGLVFNIREDMKFFKETTMGHPVLMGLNTFNSIGRALPGRKNFVVSKTNEDLPDNVEVILDLEKFIVENRDTEEEIFVIGGGMIYRQLLPYAKVLYLTEVEATAEADVFFPEFDKSKYDKEIIKKGAENGLN